MATLELSSLPIVKHRLFPQTSSPITLVLNQTDYALPSTYNYNVSRVVFDSTADISAQRSLYPVTNSEVFLQRQSNTNFIDGYTVRGTNLLLNGTPDTTQVGKTLKVDFSEMPDITLLQNDSTETLLGKKYPQVLIDMSIRRFLLLDQDLVGIYDRYKALVDEHKEEIKQELETVTASGELSQKFAGSDGDYGSNYL